ncbi:MAG: prefoldin subunit [Candidatus Woesearchaeota archaeon]
MNTHIQQQIHVLQEQELQKKQELLEVQTALDEVSQSTKSYKLIGSVLVLKNQEMLIDELTQKREHLKNQLHTIQNKKEQIAGAKNE